jgi:hypothetical protein
MVHWGTHKADDPDRCGPVQVTGSSGGLEVPHSHYCTATGVTASSGSSLTGALPSWNENVIQSLAACSRSALAGFPARLRTLSLPQVWEAGPCVTADRPGCCGDADQAYTLKVRSFNNLAQYSDLSPGAGPYPQA